MLSGKCRCSSHIHYSEHAPPDAPGGPQNSFDAARREACAGHERQKLVHYTPATFGKPDFLFAAAISTESERPYQTLKTFIKSDRRHDQNESR
jgi:hypothetical protein